MVNGPAALSFQLLTSRRAPAHALRLSLLATLVLTAVAPEAATAAAGDFPLLRAAGPGIWVTAPDRVSNAERVTFDSDLSPLLLRAPLETPLRISDWPVAPGQRAEILLTRHEIYAPDAKIYRTEGAQLTEIARSKLVFFWGSTEVSDRSSVFVSVDPTTGELHGLMQSQFGLRELRPAAQTGLEVAAGPDYLIAAPEAFLTEKAGTTSASPTWMCGGAVAQEGLQLLEGFNPTTSVTSVATPLSTATVAVDTDNELLLQKFANNTADATNYIASLIASINVMYERDLQIRLLQGTTFLRVSTTPDPYSVAPDPLSSGGNANTNQLNEFKAYWASNEGVVSRALAMMLSGKQPQPGNNYASGIATVGGLCNKSQGYSFSQVFKIDYLIGDTEVVGHEIGHNFGSPHTHCYNTLAGSPGPIDNCFSGEIFNTQACYSGATSCPAATTVNGVPNVTGTLMSYCHFLGSGCDTADRMLVFHPRTVTLVNTNIATATSCIFPFGSSSIAAVTPKTGGTAGGTHVTITGASFVAGAAVTIGGVAATGITVVNATTITATTAAHATGAVDVVVTNPGSVASTLTKSFFYAPAPTTTGFFTLAPCRLIDTRNANGQLGGPSLGAGSQRTFNATAACGVPSTAKSISANLTVVTPTASGDLALYPGNAFPLGTTSVGFRTSLNRSNNAVIELATDGTGTFAVSNGSSGTLQLIVDINGYFQ